VPLLQTAVQQTAPHWRRDRRTETLQVHNESLQKRVVVTKDLPGKRWLAVLRSAGCRVEVCTHPDTILSVETIGKLIGEKCDGVIGQLTEQWDDTLFGKLKAAGGSAYSNYAVGYNNVNVADATKHGIPVGNTPGAWQSGVWALKTRFVGPYFRSC
jgi:glycerate dehydrogenase